MQYDDEQVAFLDALGRRIRKLREDKGISQERFAQECGLNRSYYGSAERGERNISVINIKKIAEALGVKLGELFE